MSESEPEILSARITEPQLATQQPASDPEAPAPDAPEKTTAEMSREELLRRQKEMEEKQARMAEYLARLEQGGTLSPEELSALGIPDKRPGIILEENDQMRELDKKLGALGLPREKVTLIKALSSDGTPTLTEEDLQKEIALYKSHLPAAEADKIHAMKVKDANGDDYWAITGIHADKANAIRKIDYIQRRAAEEAQLAAAALARTEQQAVTGSSVINPDKLAAIVETISGGDIPPLSTDILDPVVLAQKTAELARQHGTENPQPTTAQGLDVSHAPMQSIKVVTPQVVAKTSDGIAA